MSERMQVEVDLLFKVGGGAPTLVGTGVIDVPVQAKRAGAAYTITGGDVRECMRQLLTDALEALDREEEEEGDGVRGGDR